MKRIYDKPLLSVIESLDGERIMDSASYIGEIEPGNIYGKENSLVWDEEGSFDLWENDEDDDNLWNNK